MQIGLIELGAGVTYLLLGPVAWGVFVFLMFKGRKRMRLLSRPLPALPQPPPRVSILVPAKDEAKRIELCIRSLGRLHYPDFELIAIDDRSSDATGRILDRLASGEPRLRVVRVGEGELPAGWGGKSHALHRGLEQARGEWLLFVDADVQLEPDALSAALAVAARREFDLVSLLPRFDAQSFWEKLMQPLAGAATGAMFAIALTNANSNRTAFANGQFLLVRRDVYEQTGGHEAIRGALSEDTALAQRVKSAGFRPRLGWGDEFASVRMYDSLATIFHGWSRNFYVGTRGQPWRIVAAGAFVLLSCFSAYAAAGWGLYQAATLPRDGLPAGWWIVAGLVHWTIMTAALGLIYAWSRTPAWFALLFPLGSAILLAIFARSLMICITGRVEWRGTSYTRRRLHVASG